MGRKRADLWEHADRLNKRFKCHFCKKNFPGGVVRLRYHLSGVQGGGIQLCSKVSEEAKNNALLSLNEVNKKRKTRPGPSNSNGVSSDISDSNCSREVGYFVAKFFERVGIKYNMVESSSFTNLVNAISPGSTLPSSLELEKKWIPIVKEEIAQYVSGAKQSCPGTGCTLIPIFDPNEKEGRFFLRIFGCFGERTVLLDTLEVPNNTDLDLVAPFLEETVNSVVEAVGSENIVQCIVDSSQYGESFSKLLCSKSPHVCLTKCASREVQLMFEEIYRDVGWVRTTFTAIKSIIDYICGEPAILALMSEYTNGKELKQSLDLNLLSSYTMLESILEVKEHLVQLVQSPEWLASGSGAEQRRSEVTTYIEDPELWKLGEKLQKGLRSLSQVLCSIDFHNSSSGYLYGLMEIVEHSIRQLWNNNQDMFQRFLEIVEHSISQLSEFHIVAAFLNPDYMCTEQAKNADTNPVMKIFLGRFIAAGDTRAFIKEVGKYIKIFSDGSESFEFRAVQIYHPCQWWEICGRILPILRNLAIRILSQPCSTSTCKSSMRTVEAELVKEQRELTRGITDLKMNAILMERFNIDASHEREKIVLEEFNKQISDNDESTSRTLTQLKLCFATVIASPISTGQNVVGENGCLINVCLKDVATNEVVEDGLHLVILVLDGHATNELSHDKDPYISGDLEVTLIRGKGTLGKFSFNYSGTFKLAVKPHTGYHEGDCNLVGISNTFTVLDAPKTSTHEAVAHVDQQNGSSSDNPRQNFPNKPLIEGEPRSPSECWEHWVNFDGPGSNQNLAQAIARRVRKKALAWKRGSSGRVVTLKMGSQALGRKKRGEEVPELRRAVYSSGSNNVNQQEDGEEVNGEQVELKGIDSLSSAFAMRLFGVASSSGAKPVGEKNEVALITHPSTALQLSLTGDGVLEPQVARLASANKVNQQKDGEPTTLKGIDSISSTSVIARGSTSMKPEIPTIMLFGVQVAGSGVEPTGETHDSHCPTARVMPTTEDSKEIIYDAKIQEPGKKTKFLDRTFDTTEETAIVYDATAKINNVNGQEIGEQNDEAMGLEEVNSLSCCSTSGVARDSISLKLEGSAMTLLGVRVAASTSSAEPPIRETPARANNVNQQQIVQHHKDPPLVLTKERCSVGVCCNDMQQWQNKVLPLLLKHSYSLVDTKSKIFHCLEKSLNDLRSELHELKACFMDLSLFPEDHRIPVTVLIDIWDELYKLGPDGVDAFDIILTLLNGNLVHLRCTREYKCLDKYGSYSYMYVWQHDVLRELAIQQSNQEPIENRERICIDVRNNKFPKWLKEGKKAQKARLVSICTDELFSSCWPDMEFPVVEVLILNFRTKDYSLPSFMEKLDTLKTLVIVNKGPDTVDPSNSALVASLPNLKKIILERIKVTFLSIHTAVFEKLEKISLFMCFVVPDLVGTEVNLCKALPKLEEIDISYCSELEKLPNGICEVKTLRKISLMDCHNLTELPDSLGDLENLTVLRVSTCTNLYSLPDSTSTLRSLEHLDLSNNVSICRLPPQIGDLKSLKVLKMDGCYGLRALPSSVINLEQLEHVICDQETAFLWRKKRLDKRIVIEVKEEDRSLKFLNSSKT